jgi:hypothetical protein
MTVFSPAERERFAAHYPEVPHKLTHALGRHPLLELDALARLAEALPAESIEYNQADLPIGIDGKPERRDALSLRSGAQHPAADPRLQGDDPVPGG